MTRYLAAAVGLKGFSCCAPTRRFYRTLGNRFGVKKRAQAPIREYYVDRVKEMLHLARTHGIVADGSRVLEVGTGWLHWEGMTISLFFDVEAVLFDIRDNRQLSGLKNYLLQLRNRMGEFRNLVSAKRLDYARSRIDAALAARTYEELYRRFRFEYAVEATGRPKAFPDGSFDLVVSRGVLEHVGRESATPIIQDTYRILRPRGWALHSINIGDHLSLYDPNAHPKLYLSFPDWLWRVVGENELQYINRLQRGEWIRIFESAGFRIVDETGAGVTLDGLRLAKRYRDMRPEDLQRTAVRVLLQKGGAPGAEVNHAPTPLPN